MKIIGIIATMVAINVNNGVGVGKTANIFSCTSPPVSVAVLMMDNQPNLFQINDNILSAPTYNAQILAAQYACTKPLLNGKSLVNTYNRKKINELKISEVLLDCKQITTIDLYSIPGVIEWQMVQTILIMLS